MSPILVRPVREQFEHDRVIRLLQARWRRRFDVAANVGNETAAPLKVGSRTLFPDLLVSSTGRAAKLLHVVEVETNESVNHLEAMAEWAHIARSRAPFHLYVPAGATEATRRLCVEHKVNVAEIWSFLIVGAQVRFTPVYKAPERLPRSAKRAAGAAAAPRARASGAKAVKRPVARKAAPKAAKSATRTKGAKHR